MARRFALPIAAAALFVVAAVPSFAQEVDGSVPAYGLSGGHGFMRGVELQENHAAGWYFSAAGTPDRRPVVDGPHAPSIAARTPVPAETVTLAAAAAPEIDRLATVAATRRDRTASERPVEGSNWIARHPVLFGAMVGAGAGAVAAGTMENELFCSGGDDDCVFYGGGRALMGAGIGAGVGAVVGVIVSAVRD